MKNLSKILCLALACLMALAVFAGCADTNENQDDTQAADSGTAAEEVTTSLTDSMLSELDLEKYGYNDGTFAILCRNNAGNSVAELKHQDEHEEVLENAVYLRNMALADRFQMEYRVDDVTDVPSQFKNSMTSGAYTYPIAFPSMMDAASLSLANKAEDFNNLEAVNLTESWWDQGTREMKFANRIFFMNSDINYLANDVTYIMMFCKKLATDQNLPDMYELVKNNEWTVDKLMELMQNVSNYSDDGDNSNDRYGLLCTSAYGSTFFYASGLKYVGEVDGENKLLIGESELEKITTLLEKLKTMYTVDNTTYEITSGKELDAMHMFSANQGLFYGEVASYIVNLRIMEGDFGVLPVPKYDTKQDNYYTWTHSIASTMLIARGLEAQQLQDVGQVIEAMAIYSNIYVKPAYYDIVLKSKQARDEQSGAMLDIVFAHRVYDIAQYYTTLNLANIFQSCVSSHNTDFTSKFKSPSSKFDNNIAKLEKKIK